MESSTAWAAIGIRAETIKPSKVAIEKTEKPNSWRFDLRTRLRKTEIPAQSTAAIAKTPSIKDAAGKKGESENRKRSSPPCHVVEMRNEFQQIVLMMR